MKSFSTVLSDTLDSLNSPNQTKGSACNTANTEAPGLTEPGGKLPGSCLLHPQTMGALVEINPEVERNLPMMLLRVRGRALLEGILETRGIDWYDGKYSSSEVVKDPVPVLCIASTAFAIACTEAEKIEGSIAGETPVDVMATLMVKLQGHFWQPAMSEALAREVAKDYARLLSHFPADVMREACDVWLLNQENKFFPKIGELKHTMENILFRRKWRLHRLKKLIEVAKNA